MGAVVLMYHRIRRTRLGDLGTEAYTIDPAAFAVHLDQLVAARCQALPFETVADAWLGARPLPPGAVAITFDDGYDSDVEHALPALRRRGLHAAFFVIPARVGLPGYVSWSDLRELLSAGMCVGTHGLDHTPLPELDLDQLRRQLREGRRLLADRLGAAPVYMSLPDGRGGPRVLATAREEGFRVVAGSIPVRSTTACLQAELPRFALRSDTTPRRLRALVEQRPWELAAHWLRYRSLRVMRAACGEALYRRLRQAWAGRAAS